MKNWHWWKSASFTFLSSLACTFSFARGCGDDHVEKAAYIALGVALISLTIHRVVLIAIESEKR